MISRRDAESERRLSASLHDSECFACPPPRRPLRLTRARHLSRPGRGGSPSACATPIRQRKGCRYTTLRRQGDAYAAAPLPVRERACALRRRERAPRPRMRDGLLTRTPSALRVHLEAVPLQLGGHRAALVAHHLAVEEVHGALRVLGVARVVGDHADG